MVASFGFVVVPPYLVLWCFRRWEKRRLAVANPFTQDNFPAPAPNADQTEASAKSFHIEARTRGSGPSRTRHLGLTLFGHASGIALTG